jgi:hypothetical protein
MAFTFKLEHADGKPADPPTLGRAERDRVARTPVRYGRVQRRTASLTYRPQPMGTYR